MALALACLSSGFWHSKFCNPPHICRLFRNTTELEKLSELGVLFLLFEMGLELSFDRLKVRALGSAQPSQGLHGRL